jgi:hypothetical protein
MKNQNFITKGLKIILGLLFAMPRCTSMSTLGYYHKFRNGLDHEHGNLGRKQI